MITFTVNIDGLKTLQQNFQKAPVTVFKRMTQAINKSALLITTAVKNVTPVKTGNLRNSIRPAFSTLYASISPHVNYAIYVHEGTRPHDIYPVRKKALYWKGALHPVKVVHHPGSKANPFMAIGLENAKGDVEAEFQKQTDLALEEIGKI